MPPREDPSRRQGIELSTLAITAVASALAAYVVSKLWTPGTLAAAAMTPVLVAVIKEALQRPVERVATVAPVITRRREPGRTDPTEVVEAPISLHQTGRRRGVRIAVVTGVLGFLVAAAALTVPDLVAGRSVVSGGTRATTLFGGTARHPHHRHVTPASGADAAGQSTRTQTVTRTVPAPAPARTTPQPTTTTPPPAATGTPPATTAPATPAAPAQTTQTTPPG